MLRLLIKVSLVQMLALTGLMMTGTAEKGKFSPRLCFPQEEGGGLSLLGSHCREISAGPMRV